MQKGYTALYRSEGERITCQLCRHYCQLKEGQTGICGVNKNEQGRLKNLVYGKVSALHVDPVEKKPLYHFLPGSKTLSLGTVGCNLACPFCQNWQISQTDDLSDSVQISPAEVVALAQRHGCMSIAYTYNEPTIFYPFAREIARQAKAAGLKNIFVSNGMESVEMIEDMQGVIDGFNIDLKGFNSDYYTKHLKGSLDGVLDTLRRVAKKGFWVEVTTLLIPGENDSDEELRRIAAFIAQELGPAVPWHLSAFHPDYRQRETHATPLHTLQRARAIGKAEGLRYLYLGNVADTGDTVCPVCHTPVIRREGYHIRQKHISEGRCPECHSTIEGLWR